MKTINYWNDTSKEAKDQKEKDLEKIILCEVPKKIYPDLEKVFLNLLTDSGFPGIKLDKNRVAESEELSAER